MFVALESRPVSERVRRPLAMQAICRTPAGSAVRPVTSFLPVIVGPPPPAPQAPPAATRTPSHRWTAKPRTGPQIQNVTSSVKLGCDLDLEFIARNSWNVQHLSTVFKSLVMKIRKPQTTARIFQSGILFCTGAKSEEESKVAARKFAFKVLKLGYPVRFLDFKVLNIGGTCKTFPINLEDLFLAHQDHCSYEPELFPALQYNFRPGMTASVFSSGSISLVGAKTEDEFYSAFNTLDAILGGFRRT
ncbi:uncharacterized protein LOC129172925 [Dunckerocampus dactyliophorus]|uniref:uncharacterized protein LOC129172925 n=1 Tax=Dunckerocampus dactyliophorus TaxID=161453 RepID=UPI0024058FE5|nr:uncharacterized protein LOC129172925 [Dunckerocampus dactyliophorus]